MAAADKATRDITEPKDVELLIDAFYARARPDPVLAHFFTDVDWPHHTPRIVAFWNSIIFGGNTYQGDPMEVHIRLHQRLPMEQDHFDRWLALFIGTVDELFAGPRAEEAKNRARSIASVMANKVTGGPKS